MRPTNGEISVTPASAQATAWAKLNSSVRLQWMPSLSSCSAARMPSQVLAILIRTRSRPMPCLLVQRDQLAGLGDGAFGIEAQTGIDLRRDPAGNDLQNLAAERDEQLVHERLGASCARRPARPGQVPAPRRPGAVSGFWAACKQQRRVGGGVLRLVPGDGLDIAGIGDDGRCIASKIRVDVMWLPSSDGFRVVENVASAGTAGPSAFTRPFGGQVFQDQIDGLRRVRRSPAADAISVRRSAACSKAPATPRACKASTAAAAFLPASTPGW